ncbi:hypothetical protein L1887_23444 [Cichorium endivia]|nr:hypothetical protein L1887_23444 [Cichorium endivia]
MIPLNFFDSASSSTASVVSCSDSICSSNFKTADASCSDQDNQCGYQFNYADESGTSGHYVTDFLYFDTVVDPSTITNSSASITFGCSTYQSGDLARSDKAMDGIFGFGQHDLSVISQLSAQGITPGSYRLQVYIMFKYVYGRRSERQRKKSLSRFSNTIDEPVIVQEDDQHVQDHDEPQQDVVDTENVIVNTENEGDGLGSLVVNDEIGGAFSSGNYADDAIISPRDEHADKHDDEHDEDLMDLADDHTKALLVRKPKFQMLKE